MQILEELSRNLFGMNYQVYLGEIHFVCSQDLNIENKVRLGLNAKDVIIGNTRGESKESVINDIRDKILHEGDLGSHPSRKNRTEVELLTDKYAKHLDDMISENSLIVGFWFIEGHPAYPVWWDYSYLIEDRQQNILLIGSSSD